MRFEVRYPAGGTHEVVLQGTLAVVGRDPSCDLVLNDAKCSRRHAVVEAGPDGLAIRDSGSANGIYVNGRRVERAPLLPGDEVRLGGVVLTVLPEDVSGTLVMGPDEMEDLSPPPPPPPKPRSPAAPLPPTARSGAAAPLPPPRPAPPPRPVAPPPPHVPEARRLGDPLPRPLTVMTLAGLWLLSAIGYLALAVAWVFLSRGAGDSLWPVVAFLLTAVFAAIAGTGLWIRAPWARALQLVISVLGLLTCVLTPISAVALAYMLRPAARVHFSGRQSYTELTEAESAIVREAAGESLFAAGTLASFLLSLVLGGVLATLAIPALLRQ